MNEILKKLEELKESFAVSTQAFGQLPNPVVDGSEVKPATEPEKEEDSMKEHAVKEDTEHAEHMPEQPNNTTKPMTDPEEIEVHIKPEVENPCLGEVEIGIIDYNLEEK